MLFHNKIDKLESDGINLNKKKDNNTNSSSSLNPRKLQIYNSEEKPKSIKSDSEPMQ